MNATGCFFWPELSLEKREEAEHNLLPGKSLCFFRKPHTFALSSYDDRLLIAAVLLESSYCRVISHLPSIIVLPC